MASVLTIQTGQTLNSHESFKSRLPWWSYKDVSDITDCDVILAFCPLTSRVGTDIEAALREIPEGKPLAFVVLHHTNDRDYTVPDTARFVRRPDSITVDCLFSDDGLMECHYNDEAVKVVGKFLRQHSKHSLRGKLILGLVMVILIVMCVATVCPDFTFTTNILHGQNRSMKEFELKMQQFSKELEEKVNEKVNSLKEEFRASLQNYGELENKKDKDFKVKMQQGCTQLEEKVNERVNSLQEESRASQQNYEELEKKNKEFKVEMHLCSKQLEEKVNEKVNFLEEEIRRSASLQNYTELENKKNRQCELIVQQGSKELEEKINEKIISLEQELSASQQKCKGLEEKINGLEQVVEKLMSMAESQQHYKILEEKQEVEKLIGAESKQHSKEEKPEEEKLVTESQQHPKESEEEQEEEKLGALSQQHHKKLEEKQEEEKSRQSSQQHYKEEEEKNVGAESQQHSKESEKRQEEEKFRPSSQQQCTQNSCNNSPEEGEHSSDTEDLGLLFKLRYAIKHVARPVVVFLLFFASTIALMLKYFLKLFPEYFKSASAQPGGFPTWGDVRCFFTELLHRK